MFELDDSQTYVEAAPDDVLDVYTSINRSNVAAPGRTPESAQAFIASVYKDGLYFVYIYLFLTNSNSGLLYNWDGGGMSGEELNDVYTASFEFTEAMGFMMDTIHYREKAEEDKNESYSRLPLFHADLSSFKSEDEDEKSDELLIEEIDEDDDGVELEAVEDDEEDEINLNVLGEDDEVAPIEIEEGEGEVELAVSADDEGDDEEDIALGALAAEEAPEEASAAEVNEEALLDALEVAPEAAAAEEADEEELALDNLLGEDTVEAEVSAEVVQPAEPAPVAEEVPLTPEEAEVLGGIEGEDQPAVAVPIEEPEPVAEPVEAEPVAEPVPEAAPVVAQPVSAGQSPIPGDLTQEEYDTLVTLLAMM